MAAMNAIAQLRDDLDLSMSAFAAKLGLSPKSKAYVSALENGKKRPTPRLALEIERLSEGRINAADLNPDVKLVREGEGRGA